MTLSARHPAGTPAGGRFAAVRRPEVAMGLPSDAFRAEDPYEQPIEAGLPAEFEFASSEHRFVAEMALHEAWRNDITDPELVVAAIQRACTDRGLEVPGKLAILFSDSLGELVHNRWPSHEPEVVPASDPIGTPGAVTWKGADIPPAEAARWVAAGVPAPATAVAFKDRNLNVDDAALIFDRPDTSTSAYAPSEVGTFHPQHPITLGEAVREGFIDLDRAPEFVAMERARIARMSSAAGF